MQDSDLDGLFAAARADGPMASGTLLARIEADALAEQARRAAPARVVRRPGLWARGLAALGGMRVAAGLFTATLVGVWIGMAQPVALTGIADQVSMSLSDDTGFDTVELIPSLDPFAAEVSG